jgi:hypothetical protein
MMQNWVYDSLFHRCLDVFHRFFCSRYSLGLEILALPVSSWAYSSANAPPRLQKRIGRMGRRRAVVPSASPLPAAANKKQYVDFDVCASTAAGFYS